MRVPRSQWTLLDALVEASPGASVDAAFAKLRTRLTELERLRPLDPPRGFCGTLRGYQREGLAWMKLMQDLGFGCCLADEMGLGKTVQVLALLLRRRRMAGHIPSLVVAPRSVVFNWAHEARRFTPSLRVAVYAGPDRPSFDSVLAEADVVISTYGLMRSEAEPFTSAEFDAVVLDEAQAIKNFDSVTARVARALRARCRLTLTGTPVENHLGELCSLLEFLNPGMFQASPMLERMLTGDPARAESLKVIQRASRPFLLRRTKVQVAPELPERIEQTVFVELEGAERRRYEELLAHYRDRIHRRVGQVGLSRATPTILEGLLRLRQAACHPGLLDRRRADQPSAKLERLLDELERIAESGQKALVFSQFTSLLGIVRGHLERRVLAYEYLDGSTTRREQHVDRFQSDPAVPIFLISLRAGGVGMNLTAAEHVFLLDPWWNPAVEAQAVDRTHRIGQRRRVWAYKLIARNTVEEKVLELQEEKRQLAAAILGQDAGLGAKLTRDDLQALIG